LLYGHREFVCLIGSDEGHAADMLESIKTELDSNELLLADFPEAVYPIHCLDGIANRCNGQLYQNQRTHISWTAKEIVLPTIAGSQASGGIIKVAGITGRIRGMKSKTPDGRAVRPSLVVLDDPQTDESARSLSQCAQRESILAGAVLGLAGPGKKISGIMPCTVIRPGDMADKILNRDKHPEWNGERTKMVYAFPANEKLWAEYAEVWADCLRGGAGIADATEFYRRHREAMDEGAIVAWAERYNHDEISAIQHAMDLKLQDEAACGWERSSPPERNSMLNWLRRLTGRKAAAGTARRVRARYDAALTTDENRRHWANADALSADASNSPEVRRTLRNRARYEVANNSYAKGIILTLANDSIGTGPRLQMLTTDVDVNRVLEREFGKWAQAINLAEKLRTMRVARATDGEAFALLTSNEKLGTPVTLDLRLVEAEQVTTPNLQFGKPGAVDGMEFDSFGNPALFHILRYHPGDTVFEATCDALPASAVIHYFRCDRPGQHRGVPDITPALPLFAQLRRFTLAVIAAAETAADFAGILYTDAPANGEGALAFSSS
jgi:hypothetical protein